MRSAAFVWGLALASSLAGGARAGDPPTSEVLVADLDDDDVDGLPDGASARVSPASFASLTLLPSRLEGATFHAAAHGGDVVRVVTEGGVVPWGESTTKAALQGRRVGRATLTTKRRDGKSEELAVTVVGLGFRDGSGRSVDAVRGRASLERTPPEVAPAAEATYDDPDALRAELRVPRGVEAPKSLMVESFGAAGARLDALSRVPLREVPCAGDERCFVTVPLRFVVDDVDRSHPVASERSVRAEVGGAVALRVDGGTQSLRVEGPRVGKGRAPRLRATLRALVVRVAPGGAPAVGGNDAGALALLRSELALASATWGQCGLTFGPAEAFDLRVVDPPPPFLVSFGHDLGLPASGGDLALRVDGKALSFRIGPRTIAEQAARELVERVQKLGFKATLSPNARIAPGATPSLDVLVRRKNGTPVAVELLSTTEPALGVRVGRVDLSDGLQHFGDMDSMAGTLEERTLLKAFDDGDPTTLEVFVVPAFASGGRIGESFIASDLSSIRNVVLLDRAGLRARRSSLTLAHELGHVLLNMPGHPDDFGVDTPTSLMDSDAADASAYGPRRLSVEDCARVLREAGPEARVPLLKPWPLEPFFRR